MDPNHIEPTEKQTEFITSNSKFTCFSGGFGCVAGETKIFDPLTGKHHRIDSGKGFSLYAQYNDKLIPAFATQPKQYGKKNLYQVKTERGNIILVTNQHRFLTKNRGWQRLSALMPYEDLHVSAGFHPLTILEFFLSMLLLGVQNFWKIIVSYWVHYFFYFRQCGQQLLLAITTYQSLVPLQDGVLAHIQRNLQKDAQDKELKYNHHDQSFCLVCKSDYWSHVDHLEEDGANYILQITSGLPLKIYPQWVQFLLKTSLVNQVWLSVLKFRRGFWTLYYNHTLRWEKIASINFIRKDYYYDLHVPNLNNYLANGFINHNSGKTIAGCLRSLLLSQYPGNFGLVGRLTYPELRDTTRKTFFDICPPEYYDEANGGQWKPSENYLRLINGSEIIFRHLDNVSEKELLSLNLGWFFIDQAEEVGERVFQILQSRLRLNTIPNRYGFVVCNPEPGTWIDEKFRKPIIENKPNPDHHFIESSSHENPYLPPDYIPTLMATYPEDMIKRYIEGRWDVFENQIYSEFDYKIHCINPFDIPKGWERIVSLDHGLVNPTAVLWSAIDYDGNVYVYDEYYNPGVVSEHAKAILNKSFNQEISMWLIDPSTVSKTREKDGMPWSVMEEYEDYGLYFTPANNEQLAGINRVKEFLKLQFSRRNPRTHEIPSPRLFIFKNCVNLITEFPAYQWRKMRSLGSRNALEQPRDFKDHALDALRYMIMSRFPTPAKRQLGNDMVNPKERSIMNSMTRPMQAGGDSELGQFYGSGMTSIDDIDDLNYGEDTGIEQ